MPEDTSNEKKEMDEVPATPEERINALVDALGVLDKEGILDRNTFMRTQKQIELLKAAHFDRAHGVIDNIRQKLSVSTSKLVPQLVPIESKIPSEVFKNLSREEASALRVFLHAPDPNDYISTQTLCEKVWRDPSLAEGERAPAKLRTLIYRLNNKLKGFGKIEGKVGRGYVFTSLKTQ